MFNVISQGDTVQTYIRKAVADELADISALPTHWEAGSSCFIIEDSSKWMLGNDKEWHRVGSSNSSSSNPDINEAIETAVLRSKLYTDESIARLQTLKVALVNTLPSENIDALTIYFVPASFVSENDTYFEYMYVDGKWELLGKTSFNFEDYYTKQEVEDYIKNNQYTLPVATTQTLGGVMVDGVTILVDEQGVISTNQENIKEVANSVLDDELSEALDKKLSSIPEDAIASLF